MIQVTRLNRTEVVLNGDLIEQIESTPDTVITLTTGQKIMVLESPPEIIERVVDYKRSILNPDLSRALEPPTPDRAPRVNGKGESHGGR